MAGIQAAGVSPIRAGAEFLLYEWSGASPMGALLVLLASRLHPEPGGIADG